MTISILALPDELLLPIALDINVRDLHNLLRTHRRFGAVGQEGLVYKASTSTRQIFRLIQTLNTSASLAKRMTHLRSAPLTNSVRATMKQFSSTHRDSMTGDAYTVACELVEKTALGPENIAWKQSIREMGDVYGVGLSLLIAQASSLQSLTLGMDMLAVVPLVEQVFCRNSAAPVASWAEQVQTVLSDRLECLTVYCDADNCKKGLLVKPITFTGFACLRELSLASELLGRLDESSGYQLPESLRLLRVTNTILGGDSMYYLSDVFKGFTQRGNQLCVVEVHFDYTLWPAARLFNIIRPEITNLLDRWSKHPTIDFRTTFGDRTLVATDRTQRAKDLQMSAQGIL